MKRHNDGFVDSAIEKLKAVYVKIKAKFGRLSIVGKILTIIGNIIKCLSGVHLASSAIGYYNAAKELKQWKSRLEDAETIVSKADKLSYQAREGFTEVKYAIRFCIGITGVGIGMLFDKAGSLMKKHGGSRRGDSMCHDSVRHCDGAIDSIANKLKVLFLKAKSTFEGLPIGKKILFLMAKAIKLVSIASMTVDVTTLVSVKIKMIKMKALIDGAFGAIESIVPFKPVRKLAKGLILNPLHKFSNNAADRFSSSAIKPVFLRLFVGALGVAIGMVTEKIATLKRAGH